MHRLMIALFALGLTVSEPAASHEKFTFVCKNLDKAEEIFAAVSPTNHFSFEKVKWTNYSGQILTPGNYKCEHATKDMIRGMLTALINEKPSKKDDNPLKYGHYDINFPPSKRT